MRERLVAAFAALAVLGIVLFAVPRALTLADLVQTREQESVERGADLAVALVQERQRSGGAVDEALLATLVGEGEEVSYRPADQVAALAVGGPLEPAVSATRSLPGGGELTLSRSEDVVGGRVGQALLPLVVVALLQVGVAVLAAAWIGGRLARPFQDLAGRAELLGSGRFDLQIPRYGVPEAQQVGEALSSSAARLDALVRRERELAVHASHELRTPLTAVRLELEDLCRQPEVPAQVSDQLARSLTELDRLAAAVTALLEPAAGQASGRSDVRGVLRAVLHDRGVRAVGLEGPPLEVEAPADAVHDLLTGVLELARRAADRGVGVELEPRPGRAEVLVRLPDGVSAPDPGALRTRAQDLGGHLALDPAPHCGYLVLLPLVTEDDVLGRRG